MFHQFAENKIYPLLKHQILNNSELFKKELNQYSDTITCFKNLSLPLKILYKYNEELNLEEKIDFIDNAIKNSYDLNKINTWLIQDKFDKNYQQYQKYIPFINDNKYENIHINDLILLIYIDTDLFLHYAKKFNFNFYSESNQNLMNNNINILKKPIEKKNKELTLFLLNSGFSLYKSPFDYNLGTSKKNTKDSFEYSSIPVLEFILEIEKEINSNSLINKDLIKYQKNNLHYPDKIKEIFTKYYNNFNDLEKNEFLSNMFTINEKQLKENFEPIYKQILKTQKNSFEHIPIWFNLSQHKSIIQINKLLKFEIDLFDSGYNKYNKKYILDNSTLISEIKNFEDSTYTSIFNSDRHQNRSKIHNLLNKYFVSQIEKLTQQNFLDLMPGENINKYDYLVSQLKANKFLLIEHDKIEQIYNNLKSNSSLNEEDYEIINFLQKTSLKNINLKKLLQYFGSDKIEKIISIQSHLEKNNNKINLINNEEKIIILEHITYCSIVNLINPILSLDIDNKKEHIQKILDSNKYLDNQIKSILMNEKINLSINSQDKSIKNTKKI